jgi:formamidopyrimidine-DNA glycosylase
MPEFPDIEVYIEAIRARVLHAVLVDIRVKSPFLLRTVTPSLSDFRGRSVKQVTRMGKRIILEFDAEYFLCLHLMVAGRLHWRPPNQPLKGKNDLAAFDFEGGCLVMTEAGTRKRASLLAFADRAALQRQNPGGLEVLECTFTQFSERLKSENRTLKRALTDPRLFSGIGNAFSDEILHSARLSPIQRTQAMDSVDVEKLFQATRTILTEWKERLLRQADGDFPEKVTAFRPDMAAHGRYGLPCPRCGTAIQRIRFADNELNYCPECQTEGRLLADRSLSRLLGKDWPKTLHELEEKWAQWNGPGK